MPLISKKEAILTVLVRHLEGMTSANCGYDLAGRVHLGRTEFGEEMRLPCISINEAPRQNDGIGAGAFQRSKLDDWTLLVQGWAELQDAQSPTKPAYPMMAAVEQRLSLFVQERPGVPSKQYPELFRVCRLANNVTIVAGTVSGARKGVSDKAFFYIPLIINLAFDPANPYVDSELINV